MMDPLSHLRTKEVKLSYMLSIIHFMTSQIYLVTPGKFKTVSELECQVLLPFIDWLYLLIIQLCIFSSLKFWMQDFCNGKNILHCCVGALTEEKDLNASSTDECVIVVTNCIRIGILKEGQYESLLHYVILHVFIHKLLFAI